MVYLSKKDAEKLIKELSNTNKQEIKRIIDKIKSPSEKLNYAYDRQEIKRLLRQAFKEKRKVKINYYSHSSDEVTNRIISVYQLHDDCAVAFCHLRNDERTFKTRSINKVA